MLINVTMICKGNICRSPLAEYILRWRLTQLIGEEKIMTYQTHESTRNTMTRAVRRGK